MKNKLTPKIIVLMLLFSTSLFAQKIGRIVFIKGKVQVSSNGKVWKKARIRTLLSQNMHIQTGYRSLVTLALANGSQVKLGASTMIKVSNFSSGKYGTATDLDLSVGSIFAKIKKYTKGKRNLFRVRTPNTVAGVRGTYEIISYSPELGTTIKLVESSAEIINKLGSRSVVPEGGSTEHLNDGDEKLPDEVVEKKEFIVVNDPSLSKEEVQRKFETPDFFYGTSAANLQDFYDLIKTLENAVRVEFKKF